MGKKSEDCLINISSVKNEAANRTNPGEFQEILNNKSGPNSKSRRNTTHLGKMEISAPTQGGTVTRAREATTNLGSKIKKETKERRWETNQSLGGESAKSALTSPSRGRRGGKVGFLVELEPPPSPPGRSRALLTLAKREKKAAPAYDPRLQRWR